MSDKIVQLITNESQKQTLREVFDNVLGYYDEIGVMDVPAKAVFTIVMGDDGQLNVMVNPDTTDPLYAIGVLSTIISNLHYIGQYDDEEEE